jgi:hypothetical protein
VYALRRAFHEEDMRVGVAASIFDPGRGVLRETSLGSDIGNNFIFGGIYLCRCPS